MQAKYDTSEYQRKVSDLVDREVVYCVSVLIYDLYSMDSEADDLYPIMSQPQYTHTFEYECGCGESWEIDDDEPQTEAMDNYSDVIDNDHKANYPE